MTSPNIIGIGNAVMDVIAPTEDAILTKLGVQKGIMQLIERERSEYLMAAQATDHGPGRADAKLVPGGSVANTLAGIGMLGLETAFIGRVADDTLGRSYASNTEAAGTRFVNKPIKGDSLPTSRSIIFVTPDGERSMNTYLGISTELGPDQVNPDDFNAASWLFLEGYLFDKPKGKQAFLKAAQYAHDAKGKAGISLSDPFCVERHRDDFRRLVSGPMDYVIGNNHEWTVLYQTTDLDSALEQAAKDCDTVVCTRGRENAILIRGSERIEAVVKPALPIDATGAGDQFAAGLIYGLATGNSLEVAGKMACLAATEVIGHIGPRPERSLLDDFRAAGLI